MRDTLRGDLRGTLRSEVSDNLSGESVAETCRGSLPRELHPCYRRRYATAANY
jgi:hypothetical protein